MAPQQGLANTYVGNDDFRGFLAANAPQYLGGTGNDGVVSSGAPYNNTYRSAVGNLYSQWTAARNSSGSKSSGSSSGGSGYGSSSGSNPYGYITQLNNPAMLAYYDDQIQQAQNSLGRINDQRSVGQQNIDNSYNTNLNSLQSSKAQADRDLGVDRTQSTLNNINARNGINQNVSDSIIGGQRLLGSQGAGRSSAASTLLPFAVAKQGTDEQRNVQQAYDNNLQSFDLKQQDQDRQFNVNKVALDNDRTNQVNNLNSGLENQIGSINQQIGQLQYQKAYTSGQSYDQARAAMAPYTSAVNNALNAATQLGATVKVNPVGAVTYTAPNLQSYDQTGITVGTQGGNGVQQQTSPYYSLLTAANNTAQKKDDNTSSLVTA